LAEYLAIAFGGRYSKDNLIRMEQRLLAEAFKLDVAIPTRLDFLSFFVTAGSLSNKEKSFAEYMIELSYIDFNFNYFASSQVSAAAVHLTLQVRFSIHRTISIFLFSGLQLFVVIEASG